MTKRKIKKLLIKRAGLQGKLKYYEYVADNTKETPFGWLDDLSDLKQEVAEIDKRLELEGYKDERET